MNVAAIILSVCALLGMASIQLFSQTLKAKDLPVEAAAWILMLLALAALGLAVSARKRRAEMGFLKQNFSTILAIGVIIAFLGVLVVGVEPAAAVAPAPMPLPGE